VGVAVGGGVVVGVGVNVDVGVGVGVAGMIGATHESGVVTT
jgi:hypothetical protein